MRQAGEDEAPRQRTHQHEFRRARHRLEQRREKVFADHEREGDEHENFAERLGEDDQGRVLEIRLQREKQDREQVLQHQHAKRQAAGQGVELALVIEYFDDDDRAAQRRSHREVERVEPPVAEMEPPRPEEQQAQHASSKDLGGGGDGDGASGTEHLLEIDLQTDHEEQQAELDLRDDRDMFVCLDDTETARPAGKSCGEICEDQRLFPELRQHGQRPSGDDAGSDFTDQTVIHGRRD